MDLQLSMDKCLCTGFDPLWADRVTLTMRALFSARPCQHRGLWRGGIARSLAKARVVRSTPAEATIILKWGQVAFLAVRFTGDM